jgi:hypothetical protein
VSVRPAGRIHSSFDGFDRSDRLINQSNAWHGWSIALTDIYLTHDANHAFVQPHLQALRPPAWQKNKYPGSQLKYLYNATTVYEFGGATYQVDTQVRFVRRGGCCGGGLDHPLDRFSHRLFSPSLPGQYGLDGWENVNDVLTLLRLYGYSVFKSITCQVR